ncbi:MAG: M20/M25/M40 family metallo-hydrolase [Candidatus Micrarchaeota archaeon]
MNPDLLFKLLGVEGISGSEELVRNLIQKEIKPYVDSMRVDKMGNLICVKSGKKPHVMLAAHMDEVGLMVKGITEDGLIGLAEVGGLNPSSLVGQRVKIMGKKPVNGVISTKKISNDWEIEIDEKMDLHDLFIDTGLKKRELSKNGVMVGSPIALLQQNGFLGSKEIVCGKALDDRLGCFILLELARQLKKSKTEITYVFTVQEEIGLYGAKTSVYHINPDWSIVVDVSNAHDAKNENATKFLGSGPTLTIMDTEMLGSRPLNEWLSKVAKKNRIPLQPEVSSTGTTDALSIAFSKEGVPTSMVGVAVRNLHTTVGICHLQDIENCIKLLKIALEKPVIL